MFLEGEGVVEKFRVREKEKMGERCESERVKRCGNEFNLISGFETRIYSVLVKFQKILNFKSQVVFSKKKS